MHVVGKMSEFGWWTSLISMLSNFWMNQWWHSQLFYLRPLQINKQEMNKFDGIEVLLQWILYIYSYVELNVRSAFVCKPRDTLSSSPRWIQFKLEAIVSSLVTSIFQSITFNQYHLTTHKCDSFTPHRLEWCVNHLYYYTTKSRTSICKCNELILHIINTIETGFVRSAWMNMIWNFGFCVCSME